MIRILRVIPSLLALLSFLFVALGVTESGYSLYALLPLIYFFIYQLYLYERFNRETTIFFKVFVVVSFMRFVVMPATIVYADYYGGRSPTMPSAESFRTAILLMAYELVVLGFAVGYLERAQWRRKEVQVSTGLSMPLGIRRNIAFIVVLVLAAVYLTIDISWVFNVHFIQASIIPDLMTGTESMFGAYLFIVMKQWLFVLGIYWVSRKAPSWPRGVTVTLLLLLLGANVGIFLGTNRSDVLVTALTSMVLLRALFVSRTTSLIYVVGIAGVIFMLSELTETREHSSISRGKDRIKDIADFQQVYLGGVYNVAIAVETKEYYPEAAGFDVMVFDFVRPMIGVNLLVKNLDIKYSNMYFNERLWRTDRRSQIIPMIGQGNLFLGPFFAPIFGLIFVYLAYWLVSKAHGMGDPLMFYFFTLSIARMGFLMGQNSMNMINDLSFNLFLFLVIYYANKRLRI